VASLDPLARSEFFRSLAEVVSDHRVSVVFSSHVVTDLERVCDYLVVLAASRVQVAGEIDSLLASHGRVAGRDLDASRLPPNAEVIEAANVDRQGTFLVRLDDPLHGTDWVVQPVSLEDLVLAYMGRAALAKDGRTTFTEGRP
jgi:ABC-2 type transport system ATP-binding protein